MKSVDETHELSQAFVEGVCSSHPLPIADAMGALAAADSLFERRDRVVECFRGTIRYLGAVTLAIRVQGGTGPGEESPQVAELLRALRRQALTDGQWVGLVRELVRPYAKTPEHHPIPAIVELFHGKRKAPRKALDGLLKMRKDETVAHAGSGETDELRQILGRRLPEL